MKKPQWLAFNQWPSIEPIYVIGHKHPDVDSIFAILEQEYDLSEEG